MIASATAKNGRPAKACLFLCLSHPLCRSCRRLRSFDLKKQDQKIAAFGSSYRRRQAAEKRHSAEAVCRFSGIAALPMPRKAPVFGGFSHWHAAC
ncbi:hypothetical protein DBR18_25315 [Pseudomonas sp. HMWF021]|nr:hypothetical protein DBR18_25315 [Pseudomonas sp. HMWF021]